MLASAAIGADATACGIRKGLYNEWGVLAKPPARVQAQNLSAASADEAKRSAIVREYAEFFQRLSKIAEQNEGDSLDACCADAAGDPLASLVCRSAVYRLGERTGSREFLDAFPTGKRGAQMIWDLETIAADQAYRLIDELFVLVLDGHETAASKYFNILAGAPQRGERHMHSQVKVLLRESPALVVKTWEILRRYQPRLKQVLAEMVADLPKPVLNKMRSNLAGFCPADNLDCPEILKLFGRPE